MVENISNSEIDELNELIFKYHKFDFRNYAITSLKNRYINAFKKSKEKTIDDIFNKITNPIFFNSLLDEILVETTELFRDPFVWNRIIEVIFPKIKQSENFRIWIPDSSSGDELYSLIILLNEKNLLEKVKIYSSNLSLNFIEKIKSGFFNTKKTEISSANYSKISNNNFSDFVLDSGENLFVSDYIKNNVEFIVGKPTGYDSPHDINMILFRNSMIYYNRILQSETIDFLHTRLVHLGYLIIGVKENMIYDEINYKFKLIHNTERIYQKIFA